MNPSADSHPQPPGRLRARDRIEEFFVRIGDFFVPPMCPGCARRLVEGEFVLCADCRQALAPPAGVLCEFCGRPGPRLAPNGRCEDCAHLPEGVFDSARAAFLYLGPIVPVIHHLKYRRHEELAEVLGRMLFLFWREKWPQAAAADRLIPIPLHWTRRLRRGFNQAESLASVMARLSGVPMPEPCLRRTRPTRSQTRLTARGRWKNVQGAFEVIRPDWVAGRRILLVDDVITTGATMASAARALRRAGAASIHAIALARAM